MNQLNKVSLALEDYHRLYDLEKRIKDSEFIMYVVGGYNSYNNMNRYYTNVPDAFKELDEINKNLNQQIIGLQIEICILKEKIKELSEPQFGLTDVDYLPLKVVESKVKKKKSFWDFLT